MTRDALFEYPPSGAVNGPMVCVPRLYRELVLTGTIKDDCEVMAVLQMLEANVDHDHHVGGNHRSYESHNTNGGTANTNTSNDINSYTVDDFQNDTPYNNAFPSSVYHDFMDASVVDSNCVGDATFGPCISPSINCFSFEDVLSLPLSLDNSESFQNNDFNFDTTSFSHEVPLFPTPPTALYLHPDYAISPVPSLTFSSSNASTPTVLHSQADPEAQSTPRLPQRTRKAARNTLQDRSPAKAELRSRQDSILIECRNQGMSYRKIKETHRFDVSESTLRGRHRALTKPRSLRPRKPLWTTKDIQLLKEAVPRFTRQTGKIKVSWKGVSRYIYSKGGSHTFAYTTCRRKWCEVSGEVVSR
ncbi:hypothetical protein E4U42_005216 [Claviceps africana]|uniref:Uncharacterized protein n=1 Tax=Claviceps africana TaxID=83212 RepID=A0A8K0JBW8_9HYPO|nr:hypothetical protein E4U42_005216 [Claviceps africana]